MSERSPGGFLSRWSRLKREQEQARNTTLETQVVVESVNTEPNAIESATAPTPLAEPIETPPPDCPPLDSVSLENDFTPFMRREKVPEWFRRQALRKLFSDPHFNRMDGLDVYIDDYTQFEPIPPEMLSKLSGWRAIEQPLQQIVSPQGYAVDIESEEGRALLQAQRQSEEATPEDAAPAPESNPELAEASEPQAAPEPPAFVHPRYGQRVGDFRQIPEAVPIDPVTGEGSATGHDGQ